MDHKVFNDLNQLHAPEFHWCSPWSDDGFVRPLTNPNIEKPRMLDSVGSLGLLLCWCRTQGTLSKTFALSFGLTKSHVSAWIRFGNRVLLHVLQTHPDVMVCIASNENASEMAASVGMECKSCGDIWGSLDRLKINFDKPGHRVIQTCSTMDGALIVISIECLFSV